MQARPERSSDTMIQVTRFQRYYHVSADTSSLMQLIVLRTFHWKSVTNWQLVTRQRVCDLRLNLKVLSL